MVGVTRRVPSLYGGYSGDSSSGSYCFRTWFAVYFGILIFLDSGIVDVDAQSHAYTVFVCSLADQQGETWGLSAREHVEALLRHGMRDKLDYALIHSSGKPKKSRFTTGAFEAIAGPASLESAMTEMRDGKFTCMSQD